MPNQYANDPQKRIRPTQNQDGSGPSRRQGAPGDSPPPGNSPRRPTKRRGDGGKSRWIRAILLVVVTIGLCIILAVYILDTANDLFGLNQEDRAIEVVVPDGASNSDVAKILEDAGVIKNPWVFRIYSDLKTKDREFQPGTYIFNSNLGYNEIIVALRSGDYEKEEVRLSFAEGRTLREIADILEEYRVCDAKEFLDYLQSAEYDYEFFNAIPDDDLRYFRLEGYVFPDTYDFYVGESVQDVARKFLRNFNDKMTDELKDRMLEMNMSIDETIILASIIQREAADVEDMRLVSSAFHNRVAMSETYPRLQSDVTVFYVNNNIKPYLQRTNQDMYDAYNTYVREGLPVGAICNPGMDAIEAALYPAESDYLFFVTDADGEFYYAETAEEHYRNVAQAMAEGGEAHGIDTQ